MTSWGANQTNAIKSASRCEWTLLRRPKRRHWHIRRRHLRRLFWSGRHRHQSTSCPKEPIAGISLYITFTLFIKYPRAGQQIRLYRLYNIVVVVVVVLVFGVNWHPTLYFRLAHWRRTCQVATSPVGKAPKMLTYLLNIPRKKTASFWARRLLTTDPTLHGTGNETPSANQRPPIHVADWFHPWVALLIDWEFPIRRVYADNLIFYAVG